MKPLTILELPTDILALVFSKLKNPAQVAKLAEVCRDFRVASEDSNSWNKFLQPEFRIAEFGEAKKRFINSPEMRKDQYVRFDQKGREWFKAEMERIINERLRDSSLTPRAYYNLNDPGVQQYITSGNLTVEQAIGLTPQAACNLGNRGVQQYITSGDLTVEQAIGLTPQAACNLNDPGVQQKIERGETTVAEVAGLSRMAAASCPSYSA